jgi:(S)-sulfolactate dehydrogenase
MRIVIPEFMDERAVARLADAHDVLYDEKLVDDEPRLLAEAAGADALIVRNRTQVRGELLAALVRCEVIGRLGVGLDNIDVETCRARGIAVIPATGANALSVAEYVIAAALLLLRGAYQSSAEVAAGWWPRAALATGREAAGQTLGLVGFGSIGRVTAGMARAIGMNVIAFDAVLGPAHPSFAEAGVRAVSLDALCAEADVVSLHVPLVAPTRNLFNAERIAVMKRGAILVNSARGGIVDEAAVVAALRSGQLGGAALDVFGTEPLTGANPFAGCPNLLLTPHIAGVSREANERVSLMIAARLLKVLA